MVLQMKSPAPSIKVDTWLRGEPLANFQPGKVYIVEFWATWCELCVAEMLQLMRLREKYKGGGLEVVGVAADEDAPTAIEARTKLDARLTKKCSHLNYRIAFDYTGAMKKLWMEPSFSNGIPTSFVVDRDGHIAFIGHPGQLDEILPKVLSGSWRTSDKAKAADTERIARSGSMAREHALKKPIYHRFRAAVRQRIGRGALGDRRGHRLDAGRHQFPPGACASGASQNARHVDPVMHQLVRDPIDRNSEDWRSWR
ncbi:TlpA family protein disulfide reductase [Mesorhizobium sp. M1423]|uniref:TlpA disulfide reductase family protein n=1 Tax=Mesorhizobium sp. M1423 TaxID=2957101 RepID=UPI00333BDB45